MRPRRWLALAALVVAVAAILFLLPPGRKAADRAVAQWLGCVECSRQVFDSVIAHGDRAVPMLRAALRPASMPGFRITRREMEESYRAFAVLAAQAGDSIRLTQDAFVSHFLANSIATQQSRAFIALAQLARMGVAPARAAIASFERDVNRGAVVLREDVRALVQLGADSAGIRLLVP